VELDVRMCLCALSSWRPSRTESGDLLAVLDELDTDTLANGRVGLLGLDTDLLEDDTLGVRRTTEGRGLVGGTEKTLLVVEIGPTTLTAGVLELAGGVQTSWLSFTHDCCRRGVLVDGLSRGLVFGGGRARFEGAVLSMRRGGKRWRLWS